MFSSKTRLQHMDGIEKRYVKQRKELKQYLQSSSASQTNKSIKCYYSDLTFLDKHVAHRKQVHRYAEFIYPVQLCPYHKKEQ